MIKLKDLLMESTYAPSKQAGPSWIDNEWYPAHTKSVLNYVRRKEYIPLTPAVVEKALGKKIPVKSFHITGPDGIRQLKYVLNRKKTISTFTATHEDESLAKGRGVQTGMGGIICFVEGHLLAKRSMDFDTTPDKQGRRWVKAWHVFDKDSMIWTNALKKAYLYKNGKEKTMKVISLNKKEIILTTNNLKFVINRKNINVSAYIDNEVVFLNCNKEKFNI